MPVNPLHYGTSKASADSSAERIWVIDLDGVVWLSGRGIDGAAQAVAMLLDSGVSVVFATNNAEPTIGELRTRLKNVGIDASPEMIVSSAQAAANMLLPGDRVIACGGAGLVEALSEVGANIVSPHDPAPVDAVVVGLTRAFDYTLLAHVASAVRRGARLIGTNEDPTHPTPDGLLPGSGAIVAAVSVAAQKEPEIAGKPHPPMAELILRRASELTRGGRAEIEMVVGDRPSTDGALARRLGSRFGLVLSGVIGADHGPLELEPDDVGANLLDIVRLHLDRS